MDGAGKGRESQLAHGRKNMMNRKALITHSLCIGALSLVTVVVGAQDKPAATGQPTSTDKAAATSDPKLPPEETPAREQTTAKSASKPLKLDPTLLQKVLQGRNTGH